MLARGRWGKSSRWSFCGGFCHFIDWGGWTFLYMQREETWKTRWHYTQMHEDLWFCRLSGIKQKCFLLRPCGHHYTGISQLPLNTISEHSSIFPSVVHFDLVKTTSLAQWILLFFFTPCHSLPSHLLLSRPHFVLFPSSIVPLDKRASDASGPGMRGDHL